MSKYTRNERQSIIIGRRSVADGYDAVVDYDGNAQKTNTCVRHNANIKRKKELGTLVAATTRIS